MGALAVFLKWWKPKTTFRFAGEQESAASIETARTNPAAPAYSGGQIFKAWSPFLLADGDDFRMGHSICQIRADRAL
nr:L-lactate permease [Bacillus subtilis]